MSREIVTSLNNDGLILSGYQKKLKTMKKKFFVIYKNTMKKCARLEYFDNERKFRSGFTPKRVIKLENCFNINRRLDTKYEFVIALSTKDSCFGIVLDNEKEMFKWLEVLLMLQRPDSVITDMPRPKFDHVWQVVVQKKGLADDKGIVGTHHVCLKSKSITFIKIGSDKSTLGDPRAKNIEIPLNTVRRCGDSHCFFYMEVGRQSSIGPGELWMEAADTMIAQNMHKMISSAMSFKIESNLKLMRKRSSSATETSKPIITTHGKASQSDNKSIRSPQLANVSFGRERCDSFPSRNRGSDEYISHNFPILSGLRSQPYQCHCSSPPVCSTSGCCESEDSSVSVDESEDVGNYLPYRFNSRSSEGVILEENMEDLPDIKSNDCNNSESTNSTERLYVSMAPLAKQGDTNELIKKSHLKKLTLCDINPIQPENPVLSSGIRFQEYSSDNMYVAFCNESESHVERPTRAYSIGSKIDHSKINKRIGISNDTQLNTTRVRAFSVGSRSNIPRCDLQRAVLFPKALLEQNVCGNNNFNFGADITGYKQIFNMSTIRNKKSTSAPLLIQNSQNTINCMSDLMEIDFSKGSYSSHNHIYTKSPEISKYISNTARDTPKKEGVRLTDCQSSTLDDISQSPPPMKSVEQTDNGYLEMKPVICSFSENPTIGKEFAMNIGVMVDTSALPDKSGDNYENSSIKFDHKLHLEENVVYKQGIFLCTKNDAKFSNKISNDVSVNLGNSKSLDYSICVDDVNTHKLSAKYSELKLETSLGQETIPINNANICKTKSNQTCLTNKYKNKTEHERTYISDEDKMMCPLKNQDCEMKKQDSKTSKSVHEILPNKNESSLKAYKPLNRSSFLLKKKLDPNRFVTAIPSSSITCTSNSCINGENVGVDEMTMNSNSLNFKVQQNVQSTLSAVKSDHKLYYASLDLPQCSNDISLKLNKVENDISPVIIVSASNSYAKIDFDHSSDSSSSSSKTFNI